MSSTVASTAPYSCGSASMSGQVTAFAGPATPTTYTRMELPPGASLVLHAIVDRVGGEDWMGGPGVDATDETHPGNYGSYEAWPGNAPSHVDDTVTILSNPYSDTATVLVRGKTGGYSNWNTYRWHATVTVTGATPSCTMYSNSVIAATLGVPQITPVVGDPVNPATGNLVHTKTDIAAVPGTLLSLTRTYNSLDDVRPKAGYFPHQGILGSLWTTNWDRQLYFEDMTHPDATSLELRFGDGHRIAVPYSSTAGWQPPATLGATVAWNSTTSQIAVTFTSGEVWTFDSAGLLLSVADPTGMSAFLCRDPYQRVTSVRADTTDCTTSFTGQQLVFTDTSPNGVVNRASVLSGTTGDELRVDYTYDTAQPDHLAKATNLYRTGETPGAEMYTWTGPQITEISETHDTSDTRTTLRVTPDQYGRVASQVMKDGDTITFSYGALNTSTGERTATVVHTGAGTSETTQYVHDNSGHIKRVYDPTGGSGTHPNTASTFGSHDNLTQFDTRTGARSAAGYDSVGRPTSTTQADPSTTGTTGGAPSQTVYCGSGAGANDSRVKQTVDASGVVTDFFYGSGTGGTPQCQASGPSSSDGKLFPRVSKVGSASTVMTWTDDGRLLTSTDPDGIVTTNVYDATTKLLKATSIGGHPTWYGYDPFGRQVVTRTATGIESWVTLNGAGHTVDAYNPVAKSRSCTVATDNCGFPSTGVPDISSTTPKTHTAFFLDTTTKSVTDPDGHTTDYTSDYKTSTGTSCATATATAGCNRIDTTRTPPFSSSDTRRMTTVSKYDDANRLISQSSGLGSELATTVYTYTFLDRIDTVTTPEGVKTTYHYDADGNTTGVTTGPSGSDAAHTTSTEYDLRGRVTRTLGPTGDTDETSATARACTQNVYDNAGRVTKRIVGADTGSGTCGTAGKTKAQITWTIHDPTTGLARYTVTDPTGTGVNPGTYTTFNPDPHERVVETTYTAAGRAASTIEAPVDVSCYNWAAATSCDGTSPVAVAKRTTATAYYANTDTATGQYAGQTKTVTDTTGGVSTSTYFADGRVDRQTTPGGNYIRYVYDDSNNTTTTYSPSPTGTGETSTVAVSFANGWQKSQTAAGATVTYAYYDNGLTYAVTNPLGNPSNPATDKDTVRYEYDSRGNRTTRLAWSKNTASGSLHEVTETWGFDLDNRETSHVDYLNTPLSSGSQKKTVNHYDSYGRNDTTTLPSGRSQTRTFWNSGAVKQSTAAQSGQTSVVTSIWYTATGQKSRVQAPWDGTAKNTDYTYDHGGHLLSQVAPDSFGSGTLSWTWGLAGQVRTQTYPNGIVLRVSHDNAGRQASSAFQMWGVWVPYTSYTYNADGNPTLETIVNNQSRAWDYTTNGSNKVTRYRQTIQTSPAVTTDTDMTWDAAGRLATENTHGSTTKTVYGYDTAGQLTCATTATGTPTCPTPTADCSTGAGAGVFLYTYSPRGTRYCQNANNVATTYTTNDLAAVTASATGSVNTTYGYDDDGNRTSVDNGTSTQVQKFSYDTRGLNTKITTGTATCGQSGQPACVTIENRIYDGEARKVHIDATNSYPADNTWDPTRPIPQVVESRWSSTIYGQILWGNEKVFFNTTNGFGPYFYAYDHLGSAITTPQISAPASYDPYGNPQGTGYTSAGYRGEDHDLNGNVNLVHLRARDYNPTAGTFSSQDALDGVDGTPTVSNPYHYADNDPLNKVDPLGLRATDDNTFDPDPPAPPSPPPPAGPSPGERDLWDWAKKVVSDAWQGTFSGDVWGVCGGATLDAVYSVDLSGCVLDNGDKLGTIEWIGEGVGALSIGVSGGYIVSNGQTLRDLEGDAACLGGGAFVVTAEVCFSLKAGKISGMIDVEKLSVPDDFTGIFTVYIGGSFSAGAGGHLVFGYAWVQELIDYPNFLGPIIPPPSKAFR